MNARTTASATVASRCRSVASAPCSPRSWSSPSRARQRPRRPPRTSPTSRRSPPGTWGIRPGGPPSRAPRRARGGSPMPPSRPGSQSALRVPRPDDLPRPGHARLVRLRDLGGLEPRTPPLPDPQVDRPRRAGALRRRRPAGLAALGLHRPVGADRGPRPRHVTTSSTRASAAATRCHCIGVATAPGSVRPVPTRATRWTCRDAQTKGYIDPAVLQTPERTYLYFSVDRAHTTPSPSSRCARTCSRPAGPRRTLLRFGGPVAARPRLRHGGGALGHPARQPGACSSTRAAAGASTTAWASPRRPRGHRAIHRDYSGNPILVGTAGLIAPGGGSAVPRPRRADGDGLPRLVGGAELPPGRPPHAADRARPLQRERRGARAGAVGRRSSPARSRASGGPPRWPWPGLVTTSG